MAHLSDGALRRMVDDPDARVGAEAAHLDGCSDCKSRFEGIARDARSIATLLAVPDAHVDVASAFARVRNAPQAAPVLGLRLPVLTSSPRRLTFALVAAVTAAALAVVGFAASGFFYKPTTVTTVPVTVTDFQALSQLADYGTVTWTKQPQFQVATNAADASALANDMTVPTASSIPTGISKTITYAAMTQAVATFTFSADKAAAAAARQGKTLPALPKGMDGATLTVTVGPAVGEVYGEINTRPTSENEINLPQLVIGKSTAPTVTSTQVSAKDLENYVLSLPGISKELKQALENIKDPTTTLIIPVPVAYTSTAKVSINGASGVALGDNTGTGGGVVWVGKDGFVYVVAGSIKRDDAVTIADNLK